MPSSPSVVHSLLLRAGGILPLEDESKGLQKYHYYTLSHMKLKVYRSTTTRLLNHHCSSEIVKDNDAKLFRTFCFPFPGFKSNCIIWKLEILRPVCIHMIVMQFA